MSAQVERRFGSDLSGESWDSIQRGVMSSVYRRVPCFKSPFDLGLYMQLLAKLQPRTVIEIGSKFGGSALFFADMMTADGLDGRVISVDTEQQVTFSDPRIDFIIGDALDLASALPDDLLAGLERPLLVVEDSSHHFDTCMAVLQFFDRWLEPGDYVVVEDGIVSQITGAQYERYADGPNRAVAEFLGSRSDRYAIDVELCDHYGYNMTYNPNAWLRRLESP